MAQIQEAGSSSTAGLSNIEFEHLMGGRAALDGVYLKQLTESDVNDRFVVTKGMARLMRWENDCEIRVLDDLGDKYQFMLSVRNGPSWKASFHPSGWGSFMRNRGANPGDLIYFWPEANRMMGTHYRIDHVRFIYGVSPHPEGLGGN